MTQTRLLQDTTGPAREWIREYYGKILTTRTDLATSTCTADAPPPSWIRDLLGNVHDEVLERFYGCGFPIPEAAEGRTVLDLGCGAGRDVYLISQVVGPDGVVHGVDMTEEQLEVARIHDVWHRRRFGFPESNVRFHQGYIEELDALPLAPGSVDVIVSNCVVNLSPRKDLVLSGAHRLLREGGEFLLSDIVADRRVPPELAGDPVLQGECLGGALYEHDLLDLARRTGFGDPRTVARSPVQLEDPTVRARVGGVRFQSVTFRLFKLADLEPRCEDYGQVATYKGSLPDAGAVFWLDDHHAFEAGRPERVCGNTARMLSDTRFADHFDVAGDTSVHYGLFPCGPTLATQQHAETAPRPAGGCC